MGVHVDEARPDHAAVEVELRQAGPSAGRVDALDRAVPDGDVGADQPVFVRFGGKAVDEGRGQGSVRQDEALLTRNLGEALGHARGPSFPAARRFRATS